MSADIFIDTNVLVYWRDASDRDKQAKAADWIHWLIDNNRGVLSTQVLQEYYVTVTRKLKPGLPRAEAREDIKDLMGWNVVWPKETIITRSWELEDQYSVSYWDNLILAAASISQCRWILSEDIQAGQRIECFQIINPFETNPNELT